MERLKENVLNKWLSIDFSYIANKLSFVRETVEVPDELIFNTIRCLDYETTMRNSPSVNYVITVIALMWEYADREKFNLRKIVVKFLSRIGYPTSAVIADEDFDKSNCTFTSLDSIIEQLLATLNQEHNSIIVQNKKFLLTDFQINIWNSMDTEKIIGISAPTSAGKSFVILLKLLDKLCKTKFDIIYIVPTLSLLNQVSEDFAKMMKILNINNCKIINSFYDNTKNDENCVFVLTQEKAISALSDVNNKFNNDLVLVADEIQNIERIKEDNDERAKVLFDALNEFRYKDNVNQIIISGPRIEAIDQTGEGIFGEETKNITSIDSPVLNLTYSVYENKNRYYIKQYCGLTMKPAIKEITDTSFIKGYGKSRYDEDYLQYLNKIACGLKGQQNIIFSPTAQTARKIAINLHGEKTDIAEINELIEYYRTTIHSNYSMCSTLNKSVAYHHGKLPDHVRKTLEVAIHNKWINNIACTTTLLQGVNLPTQNIIIRNPHLYLSKTKDVAELSNYEMANLRGRAGRLLKDFIGRTFVLDESSFANTDGYEQMTLFDEATKELPTGYGERFDKYKSDIENVIFTDAPLNNETLGYGDLVSYIRQSVLRYGENALTRMNNVGIQLSREQVAAIIYQLSELSIPKEICYKNRYWDPFVLDIIYKNYPEKVPAHPLERGAKAKLDRMLKFLRDTDKTNMMYEKYIPKPLRTGSSRGLLCDLCMLWAKETPLSEILDKKIYTRENDFSDQIEDTIKILQNIVSYNVPLLIKPIFDIKNENSLFVTSMQAGAYRRVTRYLIELGIPRECSFYLYDNIFQNYNDSDKTDEDIKRDVDEIINSHLNELPYWIKVQVEFIL